MALFRRGCEWGRGTRRVCVCVCTVCLGWVFACGYGWKVDVTWNWMCILCVCGFIWRCTSTQPLNCYINNGGVWGHHVVTRRLWLVSIGCYRCLSERECKGKHGLCADSWGVIGVEGEDGAGFGEGERDRKGEDRMRKRKGAVRTTIQNVQLWGSFIKALCSSS